MKNLNIKAWLALIALAVVMALLLFVPAGTVNYWQAWVFFFVYFGASSLTILYPLRKDPTLLERRMHGGPIAEKEKTQKVVMVFTSLGFIALLVVPALDHRMHWSHVPAFIVILGDALVAIGWLIVFIVLRENRYAWATIEVADNQRVISTGPYAVVRHPMYAGSLLWCLGMPVALGSYWGLLAFAAMTSFLLLRLFDEERFLSKNLSGYTEYCAKVHWRLIPGIF